MEELCIGMPLICLMDLIDNKKVQPKYKEMILNYCKQELELGDSKISNELELSMLNAWFKNTSKVKMPKISDKFELISTFSTQQKDITKIFEKYKYIDGTYYIKCTYKDLKGKTVQTQLAHRNVTMEEILTQGGVEDILFDTNNDGYANSRMIEKSDRNMQSENFSDLNLDGRFD